MCFSLACICDFATASRMVQGALALPPVKIGFADPWNQKQKKVSQIYAAFERSGVLQGGAGSIYTPARRSDFVRSRSLI